MGMKDLYEILKRLRKIKKLTKFLLFSAICSFVVCLGRSLSSCAFSLVCHRFDIISAIIYVRKKKKQNITYISRGRQHYMFNPAQFSVHRLSNINIILIVII